MSPDTPIPFPRMTRPAAIVRRLMSMSAMWLALATAILCAVLPTGLPLSTMLGSAFNPSTTAVALRARSEILQPRQHIEDGDRTAPAARVAGPFLPDEVLIATSVFAFAVLAAKLLSLSAIFAPLPNQPQQAHRTRAPPRA